MGLEIEETGLLLTRREVRNILMTVYPEIKEIEWTTEGLRCKIKSQRIDMSVVSERTVEVFPRMLGVKTTAEKFLVPQLR